MIIIDQCELDILKEHIPDVPYTVIFHTDSGVVTMIANATDDNTKSVTHWSKRAMESYGPHTDSLLSLASEILSWIDEAQTGRAFNSNPELFPLPKIPTFPYCKKYIAEIYDIEPSDIDIMMNMTK